MNLKVFDNPDATASAATGRITELIEAAPGFFSLGVSGGSTPRTTHRMLRDTSPGWEKVTAWLADERWVTPDHPRCNGFAVATALFDHVPATFLRPELGGAMDPQASAGSYEASLKSIHGDHEPDVVILGLGEDGHTASLFPGTRAIEVRDKWYMANDVPQLDETRLTATYPLLWSARLLIVLVTGANKAQALASTLEGQAPAGRLADGDATVDFYVDREAASFVL